MQLLSIDNNLVYEDNSINIKDCLEQAANIKANLPRLNLKWADLYRADLRYVNLDGSDCRGANFGEANLEGSSLQNVDLQNANLKWANFHKANLKGANLRAADIRNIKFTHSTILPGGETWEQYLKEIVPGLLTAKAKTLDEVLSTGCWKCKNWTNCPIHVALGINSEDEAHESIRDRVKEFIHFFDADIIPFPVFTPKT